MSNETRFESIEQNLRILRQNDDFYASSGKFGQKGQSLIEVIIAITVGVFVVMSLVFATIFSLRNANFSKASAQATKLAQEGIERVRSGRDRNLAISSGEGLGSVNSWDGDVTGAGALWAYQIEGSCGSSVVPVTYCYLNVSPQGILSYLAVDSKIPEGAEEIPGTNFKRVVILSDEPLTYYLQKTVTSIVSWKDFAGEHESKLTTILRRK